MANLRMVFVNLEQIVWKESVEWMEWYKRNKEGK